jgi:hypothetical protein
MLIKSVTERKSRILLAGVSALMTQAAWSEESKPTEPEAIVDSRQADARQQVEADAKAYIEALNRRLMQELARDLEAIGAARVELVIAEVPTRG